MQLVGGNSALALAMTVISNLLGIIIVCLCNTTLVLSVFVTIIWDHMLFFTHVAEIVVLR